MVTIAKSTILIILLSFALAVSIGINFASQSIQWCLVNKYARHVEVTMKDGRSCATLKDYPDGPVQCLDL